MTRGRKKGSGIRRLGDVLGTACLVLAFGAVSGCTMVPHREPIDDDSNARTVRIEVVPRTPYLETFSCNELCHNELDPNPEPRQLTEFHSFRMVQHGPAIHWCTFCHDMDNYDQLCLLDGGSVTFDETYRVCAQCHGERYADWQNGIHGLQTGSWSERQVRRSCPFCHDPHVPGTPRVRALPAPERPVAKWRFP